MTRFDPEHLTRDGDTGEHPAIKRALHEMQAKRDALSTTVHRAITEALEAPMTDMRATERLLEVIEEKATELLDEPGLTADPRPIIEAITELRRRGDTLVRRDDLRRVLASSGTPLLHPSSVAPDLLQARDRLETAIGGKLR